MLPMQRITRYPLLIIAILERLNQDQECVECQTAQIALHLANHVCYHAFDHNNNLPSTKNRLACYI